MLRFTLLLGALTIAGCNCGSSHIIQYGEGEGEGPLPIGEGEGSSSGEGEGSVGGEGEGAASGGEGEGEGVAGEGEGEGSSAACNADAGDPEKARVVLVVQPFTDDPSTPGTDVRALTLTGSTLVDAGTRLDVHAAPARIAFVPSGAFAIVLGQNGHVASVRVTSATQLSIVNELDLPSAAGDFRDIRISADGSRAVALAFNSTTDGGVYALSIACDGTIAADASSFLSLRLAVSLAPLPDERAFLVGGQVTHFAPTDPDDVRLVTLTAPIAQVQAFDFAHDDIDCTRVAASPDGAHAAVPNSSLASTESGDIALYSIAGDVVTEIDRVHGFDDAAEALFSPDGKTLLVSQVEPNKVAVFDVSNGTLTSSTAVTGVGLAEQMDLVARGATAGLVLVAATDTDGTANVHLIRINATAGSTTDLGRVPLGTASTDIPTAIALQP